MGRKIIIVFCLLLAAGQAWGETYCVKPDGGVSAANKSNAVVYSAEVCSAVTEAGDNAGGALSIATASTATFSAGDTVYFSGLNVAGAEESYTDETTVGGYKACLYIPSSGASPTNVITYEGISDGTSGAYPLIDMSSSITDSMQCIVFNNVDYTIVKNFRIKGSGRNISAIKNVGTSGTAGTGFSNKTYNIAVIQGYNELDATKGNDCFSCSETAQVEHYNASATKCRRGDATTASNQCFTTHTGSKMRVIGGSCTDSDYVVVNTGDSQIELNDVNASTSRVVMASAGSDTTSAAYIKVNRGTWVVDTPSKLADITSGANNTLVEFNSTNINITVGGLNYIRGGTLRFNDCNLAWGALGVQNWSVLAPTAGPVSSIQVYDSVLSFTSETSTVFSSETTSTSGSIYDIKRNIILGPVNRIIVGRGESVSNISNNLIASSSITNSTIWARSENPVINLYNNTVYRSSQGGIFFVRAAGTITGINNIFYNVESICGAVGDCAGDGYVFSYNDYYNASSLSNPGIGSITSDPLFVATGTNFRLKPTSPAIDAGVAWQTYPQAQAAGVTVYGAAPDIGAYEYRKIESTIVPRPIIFDAPQPPCVSTNAACYVQ